MYFTHNCKVHCIAKILGLSKISILGVRLHVCVRIVKNAQPVCLMPAVHFASNCLVAVCVIKWFCTPVGQYKT